MKLKLILVFLFIFTAFAVFPQRDFSNSDITKVVMLGTGNPNPSPDQSGCSVAIVVNDTPYIVDFGPEGVTNMTNHILEAYEDDIHYRLYGDEPANNQGWRVNSHEFSQEIVMSGDCAPSEKVIEYSKGADILIHEVYSKSGYNKKSESWKKYHAVHHTSTLELAEIAEKAKPKLIVLYHILFWGSTAKNLLTIYNLQLTIYNSITCKLY